MLYIATEYRADGLLAINLPSSVNADQWEGQGYTIKGEYYFETDSIIWYNNGVPQTEVFVSNPLQNVHFAMSITGILFFFFF